MVPATVDEWSDEEGWGVLSAPEVVAEGIWAQFSAVEMEGFKVTGGRPKGRGDPDWVVSGELGADGTAMAVLVSADGQIASPIVSGGPAVLDCSE